MDIDLDINNYDLDSLVALFKIPIHFEEHHLNNEWFNNMLALLKPNGKLFVPLINKTFNKLGEEI